MTDLENLPEILSVMRQIAAALPTEDRILRIGEVESTTGLPRAQVYRQEAAGAFPRRVALTAEGRSIGWRSSAVQG